jgi:putative PIN family toxin of toxin-antitoxin system
MLTVVLDTNVLISSLLSSKGAPAKILDLILGDQVVVVYDNRILGEYEEVLSRQEFHIHPSKAFAIVNHIEVSGHYIESEKLPIGGFTDPDDIMFAEVFITSEADALVTGNLKHYKPLLGKNMLVQTPAQFLERFFPRQE